MFEIFDLEEFSILQQFNKTMIQAAMEFADQQSPDRAEKVFLLNMPMGFGTM